jgi:hypothetical protein
MSGIPEMDFRSMVSAAPLPLSDAEAAAAGLLAWAGADDDGAVPSLVLEVELLVQADVASAMPAAQAAAAIQFLIMLLP